MIKLIINAIKVGLPLLATFGVHTVVDNAIKSTTPTNLSKFKNSLVKVGTWVLTFIVTDKVAEYVEKRIKEFTLMFKKKQEEIIKETTEKEA